MLFGARALQGAFAAVMAPAALSLLTVTFTEPRERARAFGVYGAIAGRRGRHRPRAGWDADPAGVVALDAAHQRAHRPAGRGGSEPGGPREQGRVQGGYDLPGAVTVTGALFLLVYGFTVAGTHGWAAPFTIALLAGSAAVS